MRHRELRVTDNGFRGPIPWETNELSGQIVDAALKVHKTLGPGLLDADMRIDLIVDEKIIVELKAVDKFHPIHVAQTLTYLRLTRLRLGLLINFNVPLIRDGIRRLAL